MWNSFILIFLLLAKLLQPDTGDALTVNISYSENAKGTIMLNVDIYNNSKRAITLPLFEMFDDSTYCYNSRMEIVVRKDGNNYYAPTLSPYKLIVREIKIRRHKRYHFQIPLYLNNLSKTWYDFSKKNYNYGEYNVMLRVELKPLLGPTFDSNVIKIKYNKP